MDLAITRKGKTPYAISMLLPAFAIYVWLTILSPLSDSDTRYSVYLLVAVLSMLCLYSNHQHQIVRRKKEDIVLGFCSGLFSLAVVLANWNLFVPLVVLENLFDVLCTLLSGYIVCYEILLCMWNRFPIQSTIVERNHSKAVFLSVFLSVSLIELIFIFFVLYPGILPWDAYSTMGQILSGVYNNIMPFWHTVTVEVFVDLGLLLFGDINAAVALFHCGQVFFMAAAFAYAIMTLYQIGVPIGVIIGVYLMYAVTPHNIVNGVTMLKDVPFAGAALLFVTAFYRLLYPLVKSSKWDYVALIFGILGFSLWRTNGWYAFAVVTLLMLLLLRKEQKKLLIIMVILLVVGWFLIGPLLDSLEVTSTNFVEAFAVPMQQIARVVHNDRPLTAEETHLLSEIFWLNKVKELYDPRDVDPIKFEAYKSYSEHSYIMEHAGEYLSLYIRLGLRYPVDYLQAWIEQTKGYWNGGYYYGSYMLTMGKEEEFGIVQIQKENMIASVYKAWFRYVAKLEFLQFIDSIGLYTWILAACCVINVLKKRKVFLLTVPMLVLVLGLCLGTPIFAEFRYAYPMVLTAPFILAVTCFEKQESI